MDAFWQHLPNTILAAAAFVSSVAAAVFSLRNGRKIDDNTKITERTKVAVNDVSLATNKFDSVMRANAEETKKEAVTAAISVAAKAVLVADTVASKAADAVNSLGEKTDRLYEKINGRLDEQRTDAQKAADAAIAAAYAQGTLEGRKEFAETAERIARHEQRNREHEAAMKEAFEKMVEKIALLEKNQVPNAS